MPPVNKTIRLSGEQVRFRAAHTRKGSLVVIAGIPADIGKHLVVEQATVIGRTLEGLQLGDGNISRRHALVEHRGDDYYVSDLGSTNGTLLNGEPLREARSLRDGDKIVLGQTVVKFDMVDEAEADYLQRVERMVGTDQLTGLVTKHRFDAYLEEAVRAASLSGTPLCAMMMDMDGLKAINDRHGHHVGASTISQVGKLIKTIVGSNRGQACRFGGDEFSVFLPLVELPRALEVAEQIRRTVESTEFSYGDLRVRATISIGVALLRGVTDAKALLALADQALYRAKAKGRNTVSD